jgi:hypothetical protein
MFTFRSDPIIRLRPGPPGGEPPREHPKQPHPPSVVEAVRVLIEGSRLDFRTIARKTGVNNGTVSRWAEKYGWTRPPGATPFARRPERRYQPVLVGRALAGRLRAQAERLVAAVEAAPAVDPAALAEALRLLAEAREAQKVRRGRLPPRPRPPPRRQSPATAPPPPGAAGRRAWRAAPSATPGCCAGTGEPPGVRVRPAAARPAPPRPRPPPPPRPPGPASRSGSPAPSPKPSRGTEAASSASRSSAASRRPDRARIASRSTPDRHHVTPTSVAGTATSHRAWMIAGEVWNFASMSAKAL